MPAKILVAEDEPHMREMISFALQGAGFHVVAVGDGPEAVRLASAEPFDLAVLDVRLPHMDGWQVCREIRQSRDIPVLFLSALVGERDVLKGFAVGGEDYVAKPFSPGVLVARIQALLRRAHGDAGSGVVTMNGLSIDFGTAAVTRDGEPIHLTPTEFRILALLVRAPGQIRSPQELVRAVQGHELPPYEARELIKVHVRHLRHKIEPDPSQPRYVLTVRGLGYMSNRDLLREEE